MNTAKKIIEEKEFDMKVAKTGVGRLANQRMHPVWKFKRNFNFFYNGICLLYFFIHTLISIALRVFENHDE